MVFRTYLQSLRARYFGLSGSAEAGRRVNEVGIDAVESLAVGLLQAQEVSFISYVQCVKR